MGASMSFLYRCFIPQSPDLVTVVYKCNHIILHLIKIYSTIDMYVIPNNFRVIKVYMCFEA